MLQDSLAKPYLDKLNVLNGSLETLKKEMVDVNKTSVEQKCTIKDLNRVDELEDGMKRMSRELDEQKFIIISGALDGGSDPPVFQRAERERLAKACADENAKNYLLDPEEVKSSCNNSIIDNVKKLDGVGVDQMETTS